MPAARIQRLCYFALLVAPLIGCMGSAERTLRGELARAQPAPTGNAPTDARSERPDPLPATEVVFDGTPAGYVSFALEHHPALRAQWERWNAETHRIARERRLPMPTITYSGFIRPIETRVGPQRHRVGVRQKFPWPGKLKAGSDAAEHNARASQRDFEAQALDVRASVIRAYWELWLVRKTREIQGAQLENERALSQIARGRLEVGDASLAEVQQIDLEIERLRDRLFSLDEQEASAQAKLLEAVGAPPTTKTPTSARPPALETPARSEEELRTSIDTHPLLTRWAAARTAADLREKEAKHARAPNLVLGADWLEVGPARDTSVAGSGRDAFSITVGVEIPLWQGNYAADERVARAESSSARAQWLAARNRAAAQLTIVLAEVRDSARRARLHETTLIPQAQTTFESTLGQYATGRGSLASTLLSQSALLDLELGVAVSQARHAVAWAELERVVGHSVPAKPAEVVPLSSSENEGDGT